MNEIQKEMYQVQENPEQAKLTPEELQSSHKTALITMRLEELMNWWPTVNDKINAVREEVARNVEDKLWVLFWISSEEMIKLHDLDNKAYA